MQQRDFASLRDDDDDNGNGNVGVGHGAAKAAAVPGSGQQRAPGIPEFFKGGGEVEEYEWRWRWEAGGEREPQL